MLLGAVTGMTYGILAVGLVLIYRSSRIVNFAHGEIGAFGAALLGLAVTRWRVPYWIAFLLALTGAAAVGALGEVAIVRRLRRAPSLMSIVATLGFAQFLIFFSSAFNAQATAGQAYPQPSWLPEFDVGPLRVTPSYSGMLFVTPLLVLALALFLKRSRTGLAIRASANNQDAARLSAVFASRMSTLTWSIAGAVSAFTAIMVLPTRGFTSQQFLGPGLLLRALAAAVIARMVSLPAALAAGIGIGILEQLLLWNSPSGGLVEAMLFVVILVALLLQRRSGVREEERGGWTAVQPWLPLPDRLREIRSIRNLGRMVAGGGFAVALVMTLFITNATAIILVAIAAFGMVGLSLGIVTGLGGQLSLGQFALAGVGATASFAVATRTGNFFLAFACAGLVAGAVSLVIGVPSLRIRGLMLAVTTLGFALAAESWLFRQGWTLGDGADPGRPIIGSIAIDTGKKYYLFSLAVLAGGLWISRNVWRGGIGLRLRALRDNEDGARAFTIPVTRVKLQAFVLGGFLAGIAGATYGHALSFLSGLAFPISASIDVAAMTVLGGIGILTGPIIGALYIIGVPRFIDLDSAGLAATALGWLILIMYFPGGIAQLLAAVRGRIIGFLARRVGADPEAPGSEEFPTAAPDLPVGARLIPPAERNDGEVLLEVRDLTKHYGGVRAVDGVDLTVRPGETLGIIGPNGAGKTTLFELIGGFVRPDSGRVLF
ncbi:MAG: ATP-binding cassette domain-containing protein, partial [Actinomycetota bacterium]